MLGLYLFIALQMAPQAGAERAMATSTAKVENKTISQRIWLAQFEMFFAQGFCQNAEFTELCLQMSSNACQIQTSSHVQYCKDKMGLPQAIALGAESEMFGQKLGRCIARRMESKLSQKKVDPKCTDLSLWR